MHWYAHGPATLWERGRPPALCSALSEWHNRRRVGDCLQMSADSAFIKNCLLPLFCPLQHNRNPVLLILTAKLAQSGALQMLRHLVGAGGQDTRDHDLSARL